MQTFIKTLAFSCLVTSALAQAPPLKWQHTYGGSGDDEARAIDVTSDGGSIVAGYTNSSDGQVTNYHFNFDFWVVKLNSNGAIQWESAFGGSNSDVANDVHQTKDGGYIVTGFSESGDGDLQGAGAHGEDDLWLLKLDANGNKQWSKLYGGVEDEVGWSVLQTSDGGYVAAGESNSFNIHGAHGADDFYVVKVDSLGNMQWQQAYGGSNNDFGQGIVQESDGSYMVVGGVSSTNKQVTGNHGMNDAWVIHIDGSGNLLWEKTYGGSQADNAYAITSSGDGGFFIANQTYSNNGDVTGYHGNGDFWIIKIDGSGNLKWQKAYGGSDFDLPQSIVRTTDGGCLVTGMERSTDGNVTGNHGNYDFWVVKLKSNGNLQWEEALGGSQYDEGFGGVQNADGTYSVAGFTASDDGQITSNHGGIADFWVVKLKKSGMADVASQDRTAPVPGTANFSVYPSLSSGMIRLNLEGADASASSAFVQIMNETGQTVLSKTVGIQNGQLQKEIQLDKNLPAGIYFVVANIVGNQYSNRFIIQR